MQRFYILYFLVFMPAAVISQPNYQWSVSSGGIKQDFARSCVTDNYGNIYTAGVFSDVVDFDPGPAVFTMTSSPQESLFVTKHDSLGHLIWAKQFSGSSSQANKISLDSQGNVYLTGYFIGTVDFNPGPATYTLISAPNGYTDVFVCKLNSDGEFIWAAQTGGESNDIGYGVTTDSDGNVYVCGHFTGTADFDPASSSYTLSSAGGADCFIWKLSSAGNFVWAKTISGYSYQVGYSLGISNNNSIFITGYSYSQCDFDPGPGTYTITSQWLGDVFIGKYTINGELLWAKTFGGTQDEIGKDLEIDNSGNILLCGYFLSASVDFDPGPDSCIKNSANGPGFVTKFDSVGNFQWAHQFGGWNSSVEGITVNQNKIYFTGYFTSSVDFDPGPGEKILSSNGGTDIFICQFNANGNFECAESIGSTNGNDVGASISVFENSIYVCGHFADAMDFDPSASTSGHMANGNTDMFVAKYKSCNAIVSTPENENTLSAIKIFPNPASQFIFQSQTTEEYTAVLFSSTDAAINTFSLKNNGLIDLREYSKGIYFLKLYSGNKSYTKKIIVE